MRGGTRNWRVVTAVAVAAGLATTGLGSGSGWASVPADPGCADTPASNGFYPYWGGGLLSQTFTATHAGTLRSVTALRTFRQAGGSGGDVTVTIRTVFASGAPTPTVLATDVIPDSEIPDATLVNLTGDFGSSGPRLVAGRQYAMTIVTQDDAQNSWEFEPGDPCDGGHVWWVGGAQPDDDLLYRTRISPANDDLAFATRLQGTSGTAEQTTAAGTREPGEPLHDSTWDGDHSVWYRWTALGGGPTTIDTCDAEIDSILAVYTDATALGDLQFVASNNNNTADCAATSSWPWGSSVTFNANAGQTYAVAVGDAGGARESTFRLHLAGQPNESPTVTQPRPRDGSTTRDRTPAVSAVVRDSATDLRAADVRLTVDGVVRAGAVYHPATDRLTWTSTRLALGRHTVKVRAQDAQSATTVRTWHFRVRA